MTKLIISLLLLLNIASCGNKDKKASSRTAADDGVNDELQVPESDDTVVEEPKEEVKEEPKEEVKEEPKPIARPQDDDVFIRLAEVDVGVKNYLQINATFATLTGIDSNTASIKSTFDEVKDQLPSTNSVKTFSASSQVGISKLAVAYCDVLMNNATQRVLIVPDFNFAGNVATAFDATGEEALINGLLNSFWGSTSSSENIAAGKAVLKTLLADLKAGLEESGAAQTLNISKGMCTAALSASSITIM